MKNLLKKIFYFKDKDSHYIIQIFNVFRFSIRHKSNFKFEKAVTFALTREKRTPQLIVSLTSFPARIKYVHLAINTLLNQTLKPDRVILWLADSQFLNKEKDLPHDLLKLKDLGLEIKWCEDLRSYKKLIPALREFPNEIIVTADDDLYYEKNWLEKLYNAYLKNPQNIYVNRACRLKFENDKVSKYSQRKGMFLDNSAPSFLNSVFGGSGCLYPPKSLSEEVFSDKREQITNYSDDHWFWAMAVLAGTKICEVDGVNSNFYVIDGTLDSALYKTNSDVNTIDFYYKIFEQYPLILKRLREEAGKK